MFITALSIAFTMQSCAQESDSKSAPEKVLTSFSAKFPGANQIVA